MPQPDRSQVHIDAANTDVAIAYFQADTNFIGKLVFPVVPVDKQTDKYYTFDKAGFLRDDMQRRAPGTRSAGSGFTLSNTAYSCDVFALHKDLDNQTRANWDDGPLGDPGEKVTRYLMQQAMQRMERQWVTDFFGTGIWGTDVTGGTDFTAWSNYSTSDPINDVELGKEVILKNTGFEPNTLVFGYQAWRILKQHPDIVERLKGAAGPANPAIVTKEAVAAIFEVERILVGKAVKATNVENETAAQDFIHGKNALLCYAAPEPSKEVPSAGYTFMWKGVGNGTGVISVETWWEQGIKSDVYEVEMGFDNVKTGADLGYFFASAVA